MADEHDDDLASEVAEDEPIERDLFNVEEDEDAAIEVDQPGEPDTADRDEDESEL